MNIVEETKKFFYQNLQDSGSDPYNMKGHLPEVEKWAKMCLEEIPADKEIVMLGVRLHDIGHPLTLTDGDHAAKGEEIAIAFLDTKGYDSDRIKQVAHCVRAHRCKDVLPETVEAKIIAFADSASHMTQSDMYLGMAKRLGTSAVSEKIERDYRDLGHFPQIREKLTPLYLAWKQLIKAYGETMGDSEK